jgi:hypothetical protein
MFEYKKTFLVSSVIYEISHLHDNYCLDNKTYGEEEKDVTLSSLNMCAYTQTYTSIYCNPKFNLKKVSLIFFHLTRTLVTPMYMFNDFQMLFTSLTYNLKNNIYVKEKLGSYLQK